MAEGGNIKREFWPNGQLKSEEPLLNGLREGEAKYFHQNGQPYGTIPWKADKYHGSYTLYRDDGTKEQELSYSFGVLQGTQRWFDRQGILKQSADFENGQLKATTCFSQEGQTIACPGAKSQTGLSALNPTYFLLAPFIAVILVGVILSYFSRRFINFGTFSSKELWRPEAELQIETPRSARLDFYNPLAVVSLLVGLAVVCFGLTFCYVLRGHEFAWVGWALILAGPSLSALILGLGWVFTSKSRRLIEMGTPVAALVNNRQIVGFGKSRREWMSLSYELNARSYWTRQQLSTSNFSLKVKAGDVVTVLVDSERPENVLVYGDSIYRAKSDPLRQALS